MIKGKISSKIDDSKDLLTAFKRFLNELEDWIIECKNDLAQSLPNGVHDQANFTLNWKPHIIYKNDNSTLRYLKKLRDEIKNDFEEKQEWYHGYWKMNEAHHGTEHFELFLAHLWELDPGDEETVKQMVDAAEHLGNWSQEVPDWFFWEQGIFHSFHFGTEGIKKQNNNIKNNPDHFRCLNLALITYKMTGKEKYLNLAVRAGREWTRALLDSHLIPVGLNNDGGVYSIEGEVSQDYTESVTEASLENTIDRVENFFASGAPEVLLNLWKITGQTDFRRAAEKLINIIAVCVDDFEAGSGVDVLRKYRKITGNRRFDDLIIGIVKDLAPYSFTEITLEPEVNRESPEAEMSVHTSGIGLRSDKPLWYENGKKAEHNPLLLAFAAEITNNKKLAKRALDISRIYFSLAREVYPHGHEHGCSSRSVSAIARGNGRENNSGVVTAVLEPLMKKFLRVNL